MISTVGPSTGKPEAGLYSSKTFRPVVQRFQVPEPVARALSRFADENRRISLYRAAFWLLFIAMVAFTGIAMIDRWLPVDDITRFGLSITVYCAVLLAGWRLVTSAVSPIDPEDIALTIEQRAAHLQLEERISTTVELARTEGATDGLSVAMIRRVAREAAALIQDLEIEKLVDRRGLHRAAKIFGATAFLLLALCFVPPLHLPLAYCRAFFPWMNLERPSSTQIGVVTGNTRVVDGESAQIQVQVSATPARDAYVETRQSGGGWQSVRMEHDPLQNGRFVLSIGPLHEKIQYRVRANDGQSAAYAIEVLPRPELSAFALTVQYPRYTGLPPQTFDRFNDSLSVLKGSKIEAELHANTRLSAAVLEFSDGRLLSMPVEGDSSRASFEVNEDAAFRIRLRSVDEVGNPDAPLFSIHATLDMPPHVTVLKPQTEETAEVNAVLPLEARGEDDYGIASMRLIVKPEQGAEGVVIPLERPSDGGKVWMVSQAWDLAGLFLVSGETVTYRVEATDSNGSIGSSEERRLKIATGKKNERNLLLSELNAAQNSLSAARKLLATARQDNADFSQVFRPEDIDFQSAERLLFSESLEHASREIQNAATVIDHGIPYSEPGPLHTLLQSISEGLQRFNAHAMRPLGRGAARARSSDSAAIKAGLDVVAELLPPAETELESLHEALTAAHRYAEACELEQRAGDARDQQAQILPVLLGSAGWTPKGAVFPGLLAEYYKGSRFHSMIRRTIDPLVSIRNDKLPEAGAEGTSVRWSGQIFISQRGRYVFRAGDDGVKLSIDGARLIDRWNIEIVDDAEKGFVASGEWSVASAPGQCYHRVFHYASAGKGARVATWTFNQLSPGDYRVAATWMPFFNRATDAPYAVTDGAKALYSVHVDQQSTPADFIDGGVGWKNLGDPVHVANGTLCVQLSDNANQYVIADAIRLERQNPPGKTQVEGTAELSNGWHDILIEYHNCDRARDITLERLGPGGHGVIPTEQLRTPGMTAATSDARVRAGMGKAASASMVESAFARQQLIVDAARALPRRLIAVATLEPKPEQQGEHEGAEWSRLVDTQTVELNGAKVLTPALAGPLLQWTDQTAAWVKNYSDVRERYRTTLLLWTMKLVNNTFELGAKIRQIQRDASAAEKSFNDLVRAAKQPQDPRRERAMAKADATLRAIAEDLRTQSSDVAADLHQTAADSHKSAEERTALETLARRCEMIAAGPAVNLERRLNEAKTAEALAKSEQSQPNFASDAAELSKTAGELADMTERGERAIHLKYALNKCAADAISTRNALVRPASPAASVVQQQAATELKNSSIELKDVLQSASAAIDPGALNAATQVAQHPLPEKAVNVLNQQAAQTLTGEFEPKKIDALQLAQKEVLKDIDGYEQSARAAAKAVDGELKSMATLWSAGIPEAPTVVARPDPKKTEPAVTSQAQFNELAQNLHAEAERDRKAAEYIDRARSLDEHARQKLKRDAPAVAQALKAAGKDAEAAANENQKHPAAGTLSAASKVFTKAAQDNEDLSTKTDTLPLNKLADQLSAISQELEKSAADIAANLGKPEEAGTPAAQKIGQQARGFAGWDADRAAEFRRVARAEELSRENAQETNGSRAELEKRVLRELDALDKQLKEKVDQSIVAAVRKAAGEDIKNVTEKPDANLEAIARRARNGAAQLEQLAARVDKIAHTAFPGKAAASGGSEDKPEYKGESAGNANQKSTANPPAGIPIDKSTWNRLPDDLRRDLLNAAGGRFPAEYELSIRRYFKNVATIQGSTTSRQASGPDR